MKMEVTKTAIEKEAKEAESEKNKTIEKIMQTAILLMTAKHLLIYNYQYLFLSFADLAFMVNARSPRNNFLLLILIANNKLVNL
jgi:hypothetical protein